MSNMKTTKEYEIFKNIIEYLTGIINCIIIMCSTLVIINGFSIRKILITAGSIRIIFGVLQIMADWNKKLDITLKSVSKYIYCTLFIQIIVFFEYYGYDLLNLKKYVVSTKSKIYIIILMIVIMAVINIIKAVIIKNFYMKYINNAKYMKKYKRFYDQFIRKTDTSRCPWCGETAGISTISFMSGGKYADRCNSCGKYSVPYNNIIDRILNPCIDIIIFIMLIVFRKFTLIYCAVYIIVKIFYYKYFRRYVPYKRIKEKSTSTILSDEKIEENDMCEADITFNISLRKIFRLWNNKILIIIFVGKNNMAIYNPVCVRVVKNNGRFILRKISDKINVDINKGMRFFVYLGDEKIGEGTIL